jgi:hypothetical protein
MTTSNLSVGRRAVALTPSNTVNFPASMRAIYVGVGGDITLVNPDGSICLFVNVPQGALIPAECKRINATGTTASSLVGFV